MGRASSLASSPVSPQRRRRSVGSAGSAGDRISVDANHHNIYNKNDDDFDDDDDDNLRCVFDVSNPASFGFALDMTSHLLQQQKQGGPVAAAAAATTPGGGGRRRRMKSEEDGDEVSSLSVTLSFLARWLRRCQASIKRELLILPGSFQARRKALIPLKRRVEELTESLDMLTRAERMLGPAALARAAYDMTAAAAAAAGGTGAGGSSGSVSGGGSVRRKGVFMTHENVSTLLLLTGAMVLPAAARRGPGLAALAARATLLLAGGVGIDGVALRACGHNARRCLQRAGNLRLAIQRAQLFGGLRRGTPVRDNR